MNSLTLTNSADNYDDFNEDSFDIETLSSLYDKSLLNFKEGVVVKGKVLKIDNNEVLIDVGYKSEGTVSLGEFMEESNDEENVPEVGDEVEVVIEMTEDSEGSIVLSREKARKFKVWEDINEQYEADKPIKGKVIKKIKGGLTVDIGILGFLPGSQIDLRPVHDLDSYIGRILELKVIKLNIKRGNIVLSRRALLEEERSQAREETLKNIEEGKIVNGIVKNITDYGVFVDLGGMDGLLHVTDISWGRVRHPSEMFRIGDQIDVIVLKFDRETERISLGVKQITADPWEAAETRYPVSSKVQGKVVSLADYGAFIELEEGIEGLIHVSEMSWTKKVRNPSKLLAIGDVVEVMVLEINREKKRISLGLKQLEPNPWDIIQQKYSVGDKICGKVRNLTDFGAFIELDEGIDGLVHISDLSWTKRVNHPSEVLKKGDQIEAVILNIDPDHEKISLGIKQLANDPWCKIAKKYPIGSTVNSQVVRTTEYGAFLELEEGVEGLVHVSELSHQKVTNAQNVVSVGETLEAKVIRIDE
ncbi:MAG: 30S ribosomal protein S1, partial [bacterium]